MLEQFTAIIRGHHLVLPSGVSLVIKTLIVLEGTARQLSPSFNLMELVGPYHDQLMSERLRPKHWLANKAAPTVTWTACPATGQGI